MARCDDYEEKPAACLSLVVPRFYRAAIPRHRYPQHRPGLRTGKDDRRDALAGSIGQVNHVRMLRRRASRSRIYLGRWNNHEVMPKSAPCGLHRA